MSVEERGFTYLTKANFSGVLEATDSGNYSCSFQMVPTWEIKEEIITRETKVYIYCEYFKVSKDIFGNVILFSDKNVKHPRMAQKSHSLVLPHQVVNMKLFSDLDYSTYHYNPSSFDLTFEGREEPANVTWFINETKYSEDGAWKDKFTPSVVVPWDSSNNSISYRLGVEMADLLDESFPIVVVSELQFANNPSYTGNSSFKTDRIFIFKRG